MSRILITGAEGQLGQCFHEVAKEFTKNNLLFLSKKTLDITKMESLEKAYYQKPFKGIINCAAYSNVDQAEIEIKKAFEINENGIQNLTAFAEKKNLFIVHFSTDYVFDVNDTIPLKEEHDTNPINYYAKSKLAGEKVLIKSNCTSTTIRISWMFSPFGSNFVKNIIELSKTKKNIKVVNDQFGRPTYGIDLARAVLENLDHPNFFKFKCYNYANKGAISWYDFANKIIDFTKVKCTVKPCSSIEYQTPAFRPSYSVLDTGRIENQLSLYPSNWEDALKRCLKRIYNK